MKIKFTLIAFLFLVGFTAYSQDSTWTKISVRNNDCILLMPRTTVKKDTSVVRDGLTTSVEVFNYSSDDLDMSMVSTEIMKPGEKNNHAAEEVLRGFRKGMENRALSMGLTVVIKDSVLAGKNCSIGIIKGPAATLYAYAVLHGRFFYVFSHTLSVQTERPEADVRKFMNSISFSKEEPGIVTSPVAKSLPYRIGWIFGKLLIPVILLVIVLFIAKRKKLKCPQKKEPPSPEDITEQRTTINVQRPHIFSSFFLSASSLLSP